MAFTVKDWKDDPDHSTPLSAAALEDMETRLAAYSDSVSAARLAVVELGPSEILTFHDPAEAVEIVPAPASGFLQPLSVVARFTPGTTPYVNPGVDLYVAPAAYMIEVTINGHRIEGDLLTATTPTLLAAEAQQEPIEEVHWAGEPLVIAADFDAFTDGDGTLTIYTVYATLT